MVDHTKSNKFIERYGDALSAKGWKQETVVSIDGDSWNHSDFIQFSKVIADDEIEAIIVEDLEVPGKFLLILMGDDEEFYLQSLDSTSSVKTLMKIADKADQFFMEYPCTSKFGKRFASEYEMQFGY